MKALNAMRICVCLERTSANKLSGNGHPISRPTATVQRNRRQLPGRNINGGLDGQRVDQCVQPYDGGARGIRARLVAPCQGSTSSRANAERTMSPVPFRSSPIDAPRDSSNSDPMSGDSAAWVIWLPRPFHSATRRGHTPAQLQAPLEWLVPDPIRGKAFG